MTSPEFIDAFRHISEADSDFERALEIITPIPSRRRPATFEQLSKIIVEQQVSLASAAAIWTRLQNAVQPFTPAQLMLFSEEELRALGLSRQKAVYCRSLALEIDQGSLNLDLLPEMEDTEVMAALTKVKGIGRWTAEIYQMNCLGCLDIWPAGDVALQIAMHHLKKLPERPNTKLMDQLGSPFKPYRTVAAQILWRYYSDIVKPPKAATSKIQTAETDIQ